MVTRRTLLKAAGAAPLLLKGAPARAQDGGSSTLRLVPQGDLAVLDPIWTTAGITQTHGYHVFDTLYSPDSTFTPQPQAAESHTVSDDGLTWEFTLRNGLTFHDGEPVRAKDVAASITRWSKRDVYGKLLDALVADWDTSDDAVIRLQLTGPFPNLLDALSRPSAPFIMPERIAQTDPNESITEIIGSGPYRFLADEYNPGSLVAYERFAEYAPRSEPADWLSGGKQAFFDRVEWHIIPDAATVASALAANEVDWWQFTAPDLNPLLENNPDITLENTDPYGFFSFLRFNSGIPPFNNAAIKRAVVSAIDQTQFLSAVAGANASNSQVCLSFFPCGLPYVEQLGAEFIATPPDLEKARAAVAEAGYAGETVVILNPTDIPTFKPLAEIGAALLQSLGFTVDLQAMDWGTVVERRAVTAPVEEGGWSIFPTDGPAAGFANPVANPTIRGLGADGWAGAYSNPEEEALIAEWVAADTEEERQRVFTAIHESLWQDPPNAPVGQYFVQTAYRSDLTGRVVYPFPLPWGIRRS
ncbi:MAG: ABC transporter substrate-binding protein [Thermomicrobiales bacterium]